MDSVCRILPNVEESECQKFVDTNFQQIVKAIRIGTEPGIACMALMVCEEVKGKGQLLFYWIICRTIYYYNLLYRWCW